MVLQVFFIYFLVKKKEDKHIQTNKKEKMIVMFFFFNFSGFLFYDLYQFCRYYFFSPGGLHI